MEDLILNVVYDILLLLITVAAVYLNVWLRQKLSAEGVKGAHHALAAKQDLAIVAVKYAEQAMKDALGGEKYRAATGWVKQQAGKIGLDFSDEEIGALIEWAVRECKDQFGDQWAKTAGEQGGS